MKVRPRRSRKRRIVAGVCGGLADTLLGFLELRRRSHMAKMKSQHYLVSWHESL